jgi:hypothetical protein
MVGGDLSKDKWVCDHCPEKVDSVHLQGSRRGLHIKGQGQPRAGGAVDWAMLTQTRGKRTAGKKRWKKNSREKTAYRDMPRRRRLQHCCVIWFAHPQHHWCCFLLPLLLLLAIAWTRFCLRLLQPLQHPAQAGGPNLAAAPAAPHLCPRQHCQLFCAQRCF